MSCPDGPFLARYQHNVVGQRSLQTVFMVRRSTQELAACTFVQGLSPGLPVHVPWFAALL